VPDELDYWAISKDEGGNKMQIHGIYMYLLLKVQ